ncbi:phosphodiester glycosidase family protein [Anaerovorax odorimutans]|uniref:phosphodiester glycosidase family protein n=1 Tax=Anaerovorax odorimutans TaxID=109327 RepID=UPI0003F77930|nr:phosphodiester glycosidase family protein [Anaerovorax odorimutans]
MIKKVKKAVVVLYIIALIFSMNVTFAFALSHAISSTNINGQETTYITLDINASNLKPTVFTAGNTLTKAQGLSQMAKDNNCIAAINGTYFEAYNGVPVPWGTIIKNGKVLHIGNMGSTVGITSSGKMIIDNLTINFKGYINGEYRSIPWRINHPSTEDDAITIFTPEYGSNVEVTEGGMAPIIENGKVSRIATSDFTVPSNGFAILYNPSVANLVTERFKIGDEVFYDTEFVTKNTNSEDWKNVQYAIGAGPSLIINGQITADGAAEGFWEAKINTGKGVRTFIGATNEGKILMGTISNASLKEAASVCHQLGLINAMCLDGGGSTSLYYNGNVIAQGRNVNNGLGFIYSENNANQYNLVNQTNSKILVDGVETYFEAYNIGGNNYFKLRDIAAAVNGSEKNFDVTWNNSKKAINLLSNTSYSFVGGELIKGDGSSKSAAVSKAVIYKDGKTIEISAYNINNNNYFKLRDIASIFDIGVTYDKETKTIGVDTAISYTE